MNTDWIPARREFVWRAGGRELPLGRRTLVAGVLNCTPDSFSDGGRYLDARAVAARLEEMMGEGADLLDIGGESTRPGAREVEPEEEWARVEPAFRAARALRVPIPLSIDTRKASVAARACDLGAAIVNDVSALRHDPHMAAVVRDHGAGVVLMHMRGTPETMQRDPRYADVVQDVCAFLLERLQAATNLGIAPDRIVVDPGIGFGKTSEHNWEILRGLPALGGIGRPLYVGASRKRFLAVAGEASVEERLEASVAVHVAAALAGAHVVRVHDVRATVRALSAADALRRP